MDIPKIFVRFIAAFDIDEETWLNLVPEFFDNEGNFIATDEDVRQWIDTHEDDLYNSFQGDIESVATQGDLIMEIEYYA